MVVAAPPVMLEQALFTSLRSASNEGYQIAAHSPGIDPAMRAELASWGPSHDSLQPTVSAGSFNCHTLSDGRWCLSVTRAASDEYSGRGRNVATWMLVANEETLDRFGYHPLRMFDAAVAAGWTTSLDAPDSAKEPLALVGRAPPVNLEAVAQACTTFQPGRLAAIVARAGDPQPLAIATARNGRLLIDALYSLLPISLRPQISFTTGLIPSLRRPLRIHILAPQPDMMRTFKRTFNGTLIDLSQEGKLALTKPAKQLAELLTSQKWCEVRRRVG